MNPTPVTLLQRLCRQPDPETWRRFVDLYSPLLHRFALRIGVPSSDAADLVQDVFVALVPLMASFQYDPSNSFWRFLTTILRNKWRDRLRAAAVRPVVVGSDQLPEPADECDPAEVLGREEYQRMLVGRALQLMQSEFEATTWRACLEHGVNGRPAAEVAAELGVTVNAVYLATSRVLRRLRTDLRDLMH
jgi:RNA polymerase sigma-70 factor (ECF subfamily)